MTDTPDRHQFQSSAVLSGEYDPATQELVVTFAGGSSYTLTGVPPDEWKNFTEASSPGAYFNSRLRGRY
jgi:KTSC domain